MLAHYFSLFTTFATFVLILAGASVTSTGSGLAVPDWPLSFGQFFPPMVGGVFFEHGHRMVAGTVAILSALLAILLWIKEGKKWLCWLGTISFSVVILQALLGGLTVLYRLPQWISVSHAVLAQTFFCLTTVIAFFTFPNQKTIEWKDGKMDPSTWMQNPSLQLYKKFSFFSVPTVIMIFIQLIIGALYRHTGRTLFLQLHILSSIVITLAVATIFIKIWKKFKNDKTLLISVKVLASLVFIQLLLGMTIVLPKIIEKPILVWPLLVTIKTTHVALGALILATSLIISLRTVVENRRMVNCES